MALDDIQFPAADEGVPIPRIFCGIFRLPDGSVRVVPLTDLEIDELLDSYDCC